MTLDDFQLGKIKGEYANSRDWPLPILCQRLGLDQNIAMRIRMTLARAGINLLDSPSIRLGHATLAEAYYRITVGIPENWHQHFFELIEDNYPRIFQNAFQKAMLSDTMYQTLGTKKSWEKIVGIWVAALAEILKIIKYEIDRLSK